MPKSSSNTDNNKSSLEFTRVNKVGLATVLVLALAVTGSAEPDGAIARPSSRAATAFVPRLGKRLDWTSGPLERLLCDSSQDCSRLALLDTLIRELSSTNARIYPAPASSSPQAAILVAGQSVLDEANDQREARSLLDLIASRQNLPRREIRASEGSSELVGMDEDSSSGSKRVAFTPRIGR